MSSSIYTSDLESKFTHRNDPGHGPPRRNLQSVALVTLAVLGVCYTLYFARAICFPVALSFVLAVLFRPLVRMLQRHGSPPAFSALVILSTFICVSGVLVVQLMGPAQKWLAEAPQNMERVKKKLRQVEEPIKEISEAKRQLDAFTDGATGGTPSALKVQVKQPGLTDSMLDSTGSGIVMGGIAIVLLYFFLAFGDTVIVKAVELASNATDLTAATSLAYDIERKVSRYLATVTAINVGLGIAIGLAMWGLGLPNPAAVGSHGRVFEFHPLPRCRAWFWSGVCGGAARVSHNGARVLGTCDLLCPQFDRRQLHHSLGSGTFDEPQSCFDPAVRHLLGMDLGYRWRTAGRPVSVDRQTRFRPSHPARTLRKVPGCVVS